MSFFTLIFKNLFRCKTRTLLTILGISIGIATIVTLGVVTEGLKASIEKTLKTGKADFSIAQSGVADLILSTIPEGRVREIEGMKEVKKAVGVLISVYPVGRNPYFLVNGVRAEDIIIGGVKIIEGSIFSKENENEIILGKVASRNLKKKVGDELSLGGRNFKIMGIFETGNVFEDGGAHLSLKTLQRMQQKEDKITMMLVELKKGADIEKVTEQIEKDYPELATVKSVEEYSKVDKGMDIVSSASWMISLLAVIIGGIGVMNTMMMSVFERTREIGVLRALGWKRRRILSMILGESFLISIFGALFGSLVGVAAVKLVLLSPVVRGFIEPVYSIDVFKVALVVALLLGLLGGFYPAYKASRLSPVEALRYE